MLPVVAEEDFALTSILSCTTAQQKILIDSWPGSMEHPIDMVDMAFNFAGGG